jgi:serine/threonine-protein kinase HipA
MLSPAFDLNPNPQAGSKDLSTAIDYSDTRASVDVLMSIAAYFRLEASDAPEVLAEVTRAVT